MKLIQNHPQIDQLVNNDVEIYKLLYNILLPKVINYIRNNRGTSTDAEEIFQEALFQIVVRAKVKGIEIKTSFEGYIFTVCKNLWIKELNNRKKEVRNDGVFELKANDDTVASILQQEQWDLFEEKCQQLTDNCRELLKDFFNKISYKVIVSKFKYSCENVAFQRVFKCKKKLVDLIKADVKYQNLKY